MHGNGTVADDCTSDVIAALRRAKALGRYLVARLEEEILEVNMEGVGHSLRHRVDRRPWQILDQDIFFRTVRASFAMRRKKLSNGLASGFPELGKTGAAEVIEAAGFDANVRGETLGIPEFARIANEIVRRRNANG